MFKIFGFGRDKPVNAPRSQMPLEQGASTRQHTDIQRELVRVVLKDTLRIHGIPAAWLSCEVLALSGRARGADMMVRLIVLKWHEPLLKFLPALQAELITGLDRFEPAIDHSKYIVSWQFAPDCGYPDTQMPDAKTWSGDGAPTSNASTASTPATDSPSARPTSPAQAAQPASPPSIVDWQSSSSRSVAAASASTSPAASGTSATTSATPAPATPPAAATKPKFDLPATARDAQPANPAPAFAATEPSPLTAAPAPTKPKFDLPPSSMDALPSSFAPTEPGPLR